MSFKLVKFQADYADEFDVYGMRLMTSKEYAEFLDEAKKDTYPKELYFGTNEQIVFNDFGDVERSLTVEDLSPTGEQVIRAAIGDEFGWFPYFGDY